MIKRWVSWVVKRPYRAIFCLLALTLAAGWRLPALDRHIDIRNLLPRNHPYVVIHERIERQFGGRNLVALAVVPRSGSAWQPAVLRKVKALTDEALKLKGVIHQSVLSLSSPNVRTFEDRGGGIAVDYLMRDMPNTPEEIQALRGKAEAIPLYKGVLVTPDGGAAMVLCDFWSDQTMLQIADLVEPLARRYSDEEVTVNVAGAPIVLGEISRELLKMQERFAISFVAISVILYFTFGTFQGALLPMATALLAVVWGIGAMAWAGAPMDTWSGIAPILIMAVAAGHSAQILKRYHEEYERLGDSVAAVIESTTQIGPVMLAAGSTAALGFLSLVLFRVPSLRNFALYTALGIVAALVLELSFIPACRSLLPPPRRRSAGPERRRGLLERVLESIANQTSTRRGLLERVLESIANRTSTRRGARRMVFAWLSMTAIVAAGIFRLTADSSFKSYMPARSDLGRQLEAVERHFEGTTPLVVEIDGPQGALQEPAVLRYVADLAAELRSDPAVVKVTSVADLLAYANQALGAESVADALPDDRQLIAQLLFLTYSDPYERFLDRSYSRTAVWAFLRTDRTAIVSSVIRRAQRFVAAHAAPNGVEVLVAGGVGPVTVAINDETTRGKAWNVGLLYLVVFLVGSALLRSAAAGALVVVPLAISLVFDLGLLGASGIELDLTTASILAIGVAIGADYVIYLIYRVQEEIGNGLDLESALRRALLTSGKAVWFVAFAIAGGYSVLSPFPFRPLRLGAILVPITMVIACASAVSLIPALLSLLRPRFLWRRRRVVASVAQPEPWRLSA